jgi:hypothetical protein
VEPTWPESALSLSWMSRLYQGRNFRGHTIFRHADNCFERSRKIAQSRPKPWSHRISLHFACQGWTSVLKCYLVIAFFVISVDKTGAANGKAKDASDVMTAEASAGGPEVSKVVMSTILLDCIKRKKIHQSSITGINVLPENVHTQHQLERKVAPHTTYEPTHARAHTHTQVKAPIRAKLAQLEALGGDDIRSWLKVESDLSHKLAPALAPSLSFSLSFSSSLLPSHFSSLALSHSCVCGWVGGWVGGWICACVRVCVIV